MTKVDRYTVNLARLVRTETVSRHGDTDLTKFYAFHQVLREVFPNVFSVCEFEDFDGSILLRWPGTGSGMPVMFMNHFDVVEPTKDWSYPPFCGEVHEGRLYGRGTLDTKGGLWGMLQAADDLIAEGFRPDRDIYFESSCTEETTWTGARAISRTLQERGLRFSYILDEGGMIMYEPLSGVKGTFAMIGMGERGCAELLFTAKGTGGHASSPETGTPLVRLGKFMAEADTGKVFKTELSPVILEMFRCMAPYVSGPLKTVYGHPGLFRPLLKSIMPKLSGTSRALVQSTIAFTMAEGSEGRGILPTQASVVGNMRTSHHQNYEASLKAITSLAKKYDIDVSVLDPARDSPLSDFRSPEYRLIAEGVKRAFPEAVPCPYIMTGASDACSMAPLTENCFRFVPFLISEKQLESIHGTDECVDVSTLEPAVEFYKFLMKGGSV